MSTIDNLGIALESEEIIVWTGRAHTPIRTKILWIAFAIIWIWGVFLAGLIRGFGSTDQWELLVLVIVFLGFYLRFLGFRYFVTNHRIILVKKILAYATIRIIQIADLAEVTTEAKRGRGFIRFRSTTSRSIAFINLKDDIEKLKETVLAYKPK